jgi:FixJ family two-component response regulator
MEEGDSSECKRIAGSRKTAVNIAKRAQMLVLAARGLSNRQIALELGANEHVVGWVRKEYNQRDLAVLDDRARAGVRGRLLGISTFLRPPSIAS